MARPDCRADSDLVSASIWPDDTLILMTCCYNYLLLHICLPPGPPDTDRESYNALNATQLLLIPPEIEPI